MKLRIKDLGFSTGGPFVSIINKHDARQVDIHKGDRIRIRKGKLEIISVVDVDEDSKIVKEGCIGLFDEVLNYLKSNKGCVDIKLAKRLKSLAYIRKKLEGSRLTKKEFNEIIKDIVNNNLNEAELTYFVSGCYANSLSLNEIYDLILAIVNNGNKLRLNKYPIVDKHSTGGVPGNRTTMILVPILAASGLIIPKTSSRAISSAAGTADTMEVLSNVSLDIEDIKRVVKKTNCCMVWGGGINLASADDRLIIVRHPLSLDPESLLLASILAKKYAVGATHVLIDIPIGKGTKIDSKKKAVRLKRKFMLLSERLKMKLKVIFTDGSQPVGNGIGPNLEARDVLSVLQNKGPNDLKEKSILLSSILLNMVGIKNGRAKARGILESGVAYDKMKEVIKAQGGNPDVKISDIKLGKYKHNIRTLKSGKVYLIDNKNISKISRIAGAPDDKGAGIYLYVKKGFKIKKNEKLFTMYSNNKKRLNYALSVYKERNPFVIK